MTPTSLVLVGPHGAGKTTLGSSLARRLDVPFEAELGWLELERRRQAQRDALSCTFGEDFDEAVWRLECARDEAYGAHLNQQRQLARVVETWHPGNAAYAAVRSQARPYDAWLARCVGAIESYPGHALIQPLSITPLTYAARYSEGGGDLEPTQRTFLWQVPALLSSLLAEVSSRCGRVRVLPELSTDHERVEACCDRIIAAMRSALP